MSGVVPELRCPTRSGHSRRLPGPAHVASSGPKTVKVTVPRGAGAPVVPMTVAVSEMVPPTAAVGVACVAIEAPVTSEVSPTSLQLLVTPL